MFDIGFMEIALIGVVALVVIGPERLPGVARTVGRWVGSARRFVSSVQADINLEVSKADELKRLLEEQSRIQTLHEILEQPTPEPDERKPVPRAVPSRPSSASDTQETPVEQKTTEQKPVEQKPAVQKPAVQKPAVQKPAVQKPEYQVKAIDDAPVSENDADVSSRTVSSKHD